MESPTLVSTPWVIEPLGLKTEPHCMDPNIERSDRFRPMEDRRSSTEPRGQSDCDNVSSKCDFWDIERKIIGHQNAGGLVGSKMEDMKARLIGGTDSEEEDPSSPAKSNGWSGKEMEEVESSYSGQVEAAMEGGSQERRPDSLEREVITATEKHVISTRKYRGRSNIQPVKTHPLTTRRSRSNSGEKEKNKSPKAR
ncbi:hypothetical protein QYF36_005990 [Acer negundo]|nr:hypothetical protein QYF36_005990 [Acer negundo]